MFVELTNSETGRKALIHKEHIFVIDNESTPLGVGIVGTNVFFYPAETYDEIKAMLTGA